jgi:hypothetical protein
MFTYPGPLFLVPLNFHLTRNRFEFDRLFVFFSQWAMGGNGWQWVAMGGNEWVSQNQAVVENQKCWGKNEIRNNFVSKRRKTETFGKVAEKMIRSRILNNRPTREAACCRRTATATGKRTRTRTSEKRRMGPKKEKWIGEENQFWWGGKGRGGLGKRVSSRGGISLLSLPIILSQK